MIDKMAIVPESDAKLSLIIPTYNEEQLLTECVDHVQRALDHLGLDFEIIVVDDGSQYETSRTAGCLANQRVLFFRNPANRGKGAAVKLGFQESMGDIIAYTDVDIGLTLKPHRIAYYLEALNSADVVVASKRHPLTNMDYPLYRRLLSRAFNILVRLLFRLRLSDTQCGFKFFRRRVLDDTMSRLLVKRYAFDVELLININRRGYKIVEAPITIRQGESRISIKDIYRMAVDILAIFYRLHFKRTYD